MWKRLRERIRPWWNRHRHWRAVRDLAQDILRWLGLKAVISGALIGVGGWLWARFRHLADVLQFTVLFGLFTLTVALVRMIGWKRKQGPIRVPEPSSALRFQIWHGGYGKHPAHVDSGSPSWVCIKNTGVAIPRKASNVIASIRWRDDAGQTVLSVPDVDWYQISTVNGIDHQAWRRAVDLEGGEDQSFVFFIKQPNGEYCAVRGGLQFVGVLNPGHWTATIQVTSDEVEGFEGTLGFTCSNQDLI